MLRISAHARGDSRVKDRWRGVAKAQSGTSFDGSSKSGTGRGDASLISIMAPRTACRFRCPRRQNDSPECSHGKTKRQTRRMVF